MAHGSISCSLQPYFPQNVVSELGGDHLYVGRFRQKARSGFETHFIKNLGRKKYMEKIGRKFRVDSGMLEYLKLFASWGEAGLTVPNHDHLYLEHAPYWLPRRETAFKHPEEGRLSGICSSALDEIQFISVHLSPHPNGTIARKSLGAGRCADRLTAASNGVKFLGSG